MENQLHLRTISVTRYVSPLREGGSLPAIVEADDNFLYVLKFRGAGQGVKTLIAELIAGEIARVIGLLVPEIVFAYLDPIFSKAEPDEEIQDLLKASIGLNVGLHYLSGAITYDPVVTNPDPDTASDIVWLDYLIANVDRTAKNTNMLTWNNELWLIDHGAAFFYHHSSEAWASKALQPFTQIKDHVLLRWASNLKDKDLKNKTLMSPDVINNILALIPDDWLNEPGLSINQQRTCYFDFLTERLKNTSQFLIEAENVRKTLI